MQKTYRSIFISDVHLGTKDSQADKLNNFLKHNASAVQKFVQSGGRYLGICMGAYWAGQHYLNILDSVDAVQYIRRPGTDTHRPHAKAVDVTWQGESDQMFFYDGCALVGDRSKFETVATYANGDAMAIIQDRIGLIGCHPEAEQFWYNDYSWMRRHWTGGHHAQLVEFADQLMQS